MPDLTKGHIFKNLLYFATPYFVSCFLQTFYGLADLFIVGQYNEAATINAVAIGSQTMHLVILLIAGLAMGITVNLGKAFGEGNAKAQKEIIENSIILFSFLTFVFLLGGLFSVAQIVSILQTPIESFSEAVSYTTICLAGLPLITAYNVLSSIFRGYGDSKRPMLCVAIGGFLNIILDYIFIGRLGLGANGAAYATVIGMLVSVLMALLLARPIFKTVDFSFRKLKFSQSISKDVLYIGAPTAAQDLVIQIAFMFITAIANTRGVYVAAGVGIVEKLITFLFLVPSAMLAAVSAICAQNRGSGQLQRSKDTLRYALITVVSYGAVIVVICQFISPQLVGLFTDDGQIVHYGAQYLRTYGTDAMLAGVHFCYSGFFCAYNKANWTFIHNFFSVVFVRVPGSYLAVIFFPETLSPMGLAAPIGSTVSIIICWFVYYHFWGRAQANIEK